MNNETFSFKNYQITYTEMVIEGANWHIVRAHRVDAKGVVGHKAVIAYRFRTPEKRQEYFEGWKAGIEKQIAEKEARAAAKKFAKENMVNPFKVGDIVYDSWGYEQTNINFYEVTEVGAKSVVIREVAQSGQPTKGFSPMSEHVVALPGVFIGDSIKKNLQVLSDGKIYITSKHGWISRWDGKPKYASHYA